MDPCKILTLKGQMEEGNLMKMEDQFKRLEEKQKRVVFCKLGNGEWSVDMDLRICWQPHHGDGSFSGAVGAETRLFKREHDRRKMEIATCRLLFQEVRDSQFFNYFMGYGFQFSLLPWLFLFS